MLSTWRAAAASGRQPAVIFNATVTETGQRFLITNFQAQDFNQEGRRLADIKVPAQQTAVPFDRNFPEHDLSITTAARLSATFPVVTPVARPANEDARIGVFHAADGGYYDNYGVASAIEWLRDAHAENLLSAHRLVWIVIRAGPLHPDENTSPDAPPKARRWKWTNQAFAPLKTLINVRDASQWERDLVELDQLCRSLNGHGAELDPSDSDCEEKPNDKVRVISFEYRDDHPPLSWHLTSAQRKQLKCNWEGKRSADCTSDGWQDASIEKVRKAFASNTASPGPGHARTIAMASN